MKSGRINEAEKRRKSAAKCRNRRGNILLLCPEVCQGDVANWKEPNMRIEQVAAYQRIHDENINQGRSLPQFHSWSQVGVPITNNKVNDAGRPIMITDSTSWQSQHDSSIFGQAHSNQSPCVHCCLLFGPVMYPLSCFINLKDLVGIFFDVVQGMIFISPLHKYFLLTRPLFSSSCIVGV